MHYPGVVTLKLLNQPASPHDREHRVRFGFGAGVGPQRHDVFEERYGFPLLERWGMTGRARRRVDSMALRLVGTRALGRAMAAVEGRAFGRAVAAVQARAFDEASVEPVIRHPAKAARKDFFSGPLDDPASTEGAWCGGSSHTGARVAHDACRHAEDPEARNLREECRPANARRQDRSVRAHEAPSAASTTGH